MKYSDDYVHILRSERSDLIERLRKTKFSTLKSEFQHSQIIPYSSYSPWIGDDFFLKLYEAVKSSTLVDIYRCYELYRLVKQTSKIAGSIVEVGVWRGGTAAILAHTKEKPISLYDTFTGVAKANAQYDTYYTGGEHADTSVILVEKLFSQLGLTAEINVGIFPDEVMLQIPEKIALAHIDVDTYQSAKDSFLAIWPRIPPSGAVIFDDYGFFGCEGVTQAVEELIANLSDVFFIHNLNGHAILVKMGSSTGVGA